MNCDKKKPVVSIIVPVYNTAEYVEECIQSILSQSYKNIELILVNDGSTDGSDIICKKYEHLPNVQYIEQENFGLTVVRKRGVEAANGKWIMFVDSDDLLLNDGILQLVQQSSDVDIVVGRHERNTSLLKSPDYLEWDEYLYGLYIKNVPRVTWAKLFKRELIIKCALAFEYKLRRSQDVLTNLAIANVNRKKVKIFKNAIYYHRIRESSTVHTFKFTFDYCENLCLIADSLVRESIPADKVLKGGIISRMYYYRRILAENNFQGNKHHPFVRGIVNRMNEARVLRLSDRMILYVSSKNAIRLCMFLSKFLSKFVRRIEHPSLILEDIKRLTKKC